MLRPKCVFFMLSQGYKGGKIGRELITDQMFKENQNSVGPPKEIEKTLRSDLSQ